jgi:signal peptidase II
MSPESAIRRPGVVVFFLVATIILLASDLGLKWWAFNRFPVVPVNIEATLAAEIPMPDQRQDVIPQILQIKLTLNEGAVFGLGDGQRWLFMVVTVAAVALISGLFATSRASQWVMHLGLAMVLAGALGNLYDRIVHAAVRDMLLLFPDWHLPFGWTWPRSMGGRSDLYPWIFNLADVYLLCGLVMLILRSLFVPKLVDKPPATEGAPDRTPDES